MVSNFLSGHDVGIVAYGETRVERRSGRTPYEFAAETFEEILTKTGMTPADIDGFATNVPHSESVNQYYTPYVCDYLGVTPRWMDISDHGGGSALAAVSRAALAIQAGMCELALVLCADAPSSSWRAGNGGYRPEFWDPTGIQGPPGAFGLLMNRYAAQYDLKLEALGKLAVAQREGAGRDCTCSFNEMVGTSCYTVGSSRRVMLKAAACKHRRKCCEDCAGYSKKQWLHSGDLMYFNKPWNRTWTHGIPHHDFEADGEIGPRMSIALLCAAGTFKVPFVENKLKVPEWMAPEGAKCSLTDSAAS